MASVPERGDVVWIHFSQTDEQKSDHRQPGLVISPAVYNQKAGLVLICPITRSVKGYPFEVIIPEGYAISGAVLSDQVFCLNWMTSSLVLEFQAPSSIVEEVLSKLNTLTCV